jgi:PqqD family protein of HPr-rel-A system
VTLPTFSRADASLSLKVGPSSAKPASWCCPRIAEIRWVEWEQDFSLFDRGTGLTHLLNAFPIEILRILAQEPRTTEGVADVLADACGVESDQSWQSRVSETLTGLEALGLVDRIME